MSFEFEHATEIPQEIKQAIRIAEQYTVHYDTEHESPFSYYRISPNVKSNKLKFNLQLELAKKVFAGCIIYPGESILHSVAAGKNDNVKLINVCMSYFTKHFQEDGKPIIEHMFTKQDVIWAMRTACVKENINIAKYLLNNYKECVNELSEIDRIQENNCMRKIAAEKFEKGDDNYMALWLNRIFKFNL